MVGVSGSYSILQQRIIRHHLAPTLTTYLLFESRVAGLITLLATHYDIAFSGLMDVFTVYFLLVGIGARSCSIGSGCYLLLAY